MIVVATESFISRKGLAKILKELYSGFRIVEAAEFEEVKKLLRNNKVRLLLLSTEIYSKISSSSLQHIPTIKLISERPEYIDENKNNSKLLFLDASESNVLHLLKRNLATIDKTVEGNKLESGLSERELEIVREVALGKTNKEIAEKLFISIHTVITHRKNITRKLGIKTVSGLTVYALLNKLIKISDSQ
jgi:DNA-binding CsgD family transcriptional regulator